ncbi:MAG: molybdopterin-synthase adenylyltransferase MoeB [Rhodobacteraceae bacterium]|nr:molybdopterin-synthase adenylyltransferase MoeB [Paracoccaceae bacterium]
MILFLILAAGLWVLGWRFKTPVQARLITIGLLYVVFLAALVVLPEGMGLRQTLGGSAKDWLAIGVIGGLVFGYTLVLKQIRKRVRPENTSSGDPLPSIDGPFTAAELDRYARHIVLREVGGAGQRGLKTAKVLVVGAGGLGAPALQYLAAAGAGTIGVIDDDTVDNSNLQRQVIHRDDTIGMPKVFSAEKAMKALNPYVTVRPYHRRLDEEIARDLVAEYDLVLDGSDNFDTRYLTNRACVAAGVPLISGAISQWEGQLSLFDPAHGTPCYECIFPQAPAEGLAPSCAEAGVIGPLPGVVGAMMAVEAVKQITGAGETLAGSMLIYDGLYGETRRIALARREDCPVCAGLDQPAPLQRSV